MLLVSHSEERLSAEAIRQHLSGVSRGISKIIVNRDYSSLRAKLRQRDSLVDRLEAAETQLILRANRGGKRITAKKGSGKGRAPPL